MNYPTKRGVKCRPGGADETSCAVFAKKLRISASTLYRLENAEQSVMLGKMEDVLKRLKAGVRDVFPQ